MLAPQSSLCLLGELRVSLTLRHLRCYTRHLADAGPLDQILQPSTEALRFLLCPRMLVVRILQYRAFPTLLAAYSCGVPLVYQFQLSVLELEFGA